MVVVLVVVVEVVVEECLMFLDGRVSHPSSQSWWRPKVGGVHGPRWEGVHGPRWGCVRGTRWGRVECSGGTTYVLTNIKQ